MESKCKDYSVWYDGDVVVKGSDIERFIAIVPNGKLYVDAITPDIKQYNQFVSKSERVTTKKECGNLDLGWTIPDEYKRLDLKEHLLDKLAEFDYPDEEVEKRFSRMMVELSAYKAEGLLDLLRCLVYIVDTFTKNNVVWGVGRGSSVSSYVLYLIGVHDIDCVLYDLPFTDFIKHK